MLIINDLIISLLIIQMERVFTFMIHNIGCLSIYAMLDYLLRYMKIKAEWAQLRAIGNGLVVACTYQDVVSCLSNHDTSWQLPLYPYAEPLVFSLYLYQCILGKMRCQDPFYHAFVLIRTPIGYMSNNKTMSSESHWLHPCFNGRQRSSRKAITEKYIRCHKQLHTETGSSRGGIVIIARRIQDKKPGISWTTHISRKHFVVFDGLL